MAKQGKNNTNEEVIEAVGEIPATPKTETNPNKKSKSYSAEEVEKMLAEASEKAAAAAVAAYAKAQPAQQILQVKQDEFITVLFIGAIAENTVVSLGKLGQINRDGGTLDIPKTEFLQGIDYKVEKLLRQRKLIVLNGLTDDERERYNVLYKEGELLTQQAFFKLLDYKHEDVLKVFSKLCESHQRIVARIYLTAYSEGDNRIHPDTVKALNTISKKYDTDGMFTPILKDMGKKLSD